MIQEIFVKRGGTILLSGRVKLPSGVWSAVCFASRPNAVTKYPISVTLSPLTETLASGETHNIQLSQASTVTAAWSVGILLCDIKFQSDNGTVIYSDTFTINVETPIS